MRLNVEQKNYMFIAVTVCAVVVGYTYFFNKQKTFNAITSFKECVARGYQVTLTYPEECRIPGKKFTNPAQVAEMIPTPEPVSGIINDFLNQTYIIDGQAVPLTDGKGNLPPTILQRRYATTSIFYKNIKLESDINNDTINDVIFLLENRDVDASNATSFYITASVSLHTNFVGVNGLFVAQDIIDTTLSYKNSEIILEYRSASTSEKISKKYIFENDILKEHK